MALFGGVEIPGKPDLENVRRLDLLPIPMIRRCQRLGMAIEREHFYELELKFEKEAAETERFITNYIPSERLHEFAARTAEKDEEEETDEERVERISTGFNAGSPEQIGKMLYEILNIGSQKRLKKTKAGKTSTGKRQLEMLRMEHPVVPLVLRFRELRTLINNYCRKLPRLARFHPRSACCPVCELPHATDQWRVHGEMGTTRAETGRINHKNPNLGNVPTRTDDGQAVQAGFVAPPGMRLVAADLSQIELRCLAHLANCRSMIQVYEEDGDIHDDTCHKALGVPLDQKPDKIKHRMAAKRVNFGIQNGTTEKGLYLQLVMDFGQSKMPVPDWLTEDWCAWFIGQWLESRPEVEEWFRLQWYRARKYGMSWDLFGRVRLIPEVQSCHSWIREQGLRQAQNMPVTSTAAGQLKLAMGASEEMLRGLYESGVWCWPLLTIHDAIMVEAEEDYAEVVKEVLTGVMDNVMRDEETGEWRFRVPIKSDASVTERWVKE